ncbi:uncharacterized protein F4812DRAFT_43384 [Daldinia caldariorum]|uniref:uncharacterized protein n=1 Tax=Daldinia caldariorum TaxID=326644 RepID=UPI002008E9E9|nr:uncharacterized protein F4812DRAFT_43384 [Daldinia caldariorum]KAI1473237.1 hypothetical protein F4812DRAFT_43384 [Daldinia caldariorum]
MWVHKNPKKITFQFCGVSRIRSSKLRYVIFCMDLVINEKGVNRRSGYPCLGSWNWKVMRNHLYQMIMVLWVSGGGGGVSLFSLLLGAWYITAEYTEYRGRRDIKFFCITSNSSFAQFAVATYICNMQESPICYRHR